MLTERRINTAYHQRGLTMIELMVGLAIVAILLLVGMPDFGARKDKRHIKGAAEVIQQDLRFARSEAIKRNEQVSLSFTKTNDTTWCYGVVAGAGSCTCDPTDCSSTAGTDCEINDGVEHTRCSSDIGEGTVSLLSTTFTSDDVSFDPNHGTASEAAEVKLQSGQGVDVWLQVSALGRVRVCSPETNSYGFETDDCD